MAEAPAGLSEDEARRRLAESGPNEVVESAPSLVRTLAGRFWGPVAWMLEAALAIELVLRQLPEAVILLGLLAFNATLAEIQERRAQEAVRLLRHRLQVTSRVCRGGVWRAIPARELVPGDRVHVRIGDIVPADATVTDGAVEVDQSTLTGESAAVSRSAGERLYSGSIIRRGEASADVSATGARSYFGKTTELVRSARSVSHLERLLFAVVRYLVALDSILAGSVLVVAAYRGFPLLDVLPFVLILLIASVPAAMPATFTIANAVESRRLVDQGVLVTGLSAVQEAASVDLLCVDKTGTLTEGRETLTEVLPAPGRDVASVLARAAAASDAATQDTIDLAVLAEARRQGVVPLTRTALKPFDPALKRSEATVVVEGRSRRVVVGSPAVVLGLCRPDPAAESVVERLAAGGARVLVVAEGEDDRLEVVGYLALPDPPRADAAALVRSLAELGIRTVMVTGDTVPTARAVARRLGLGERVGGPGDLRARPSSFDVFAGVFPEDKFELVRGLQREGFTVAMTGDGVNDAPALKQAEVGIAVASATDVARASAKLVLTRPGLSDVVSAIRGGRAVYRRMLTWTLNKVAKNIEQVILLTSGFLALGIFVTTPFLILLLVFANDFVSMSVGTDRARVSATPDRWDMREITAVAVVIGGSWLAVSITLLAWAVDVAHLGIGVLQTLFFVYLVFSGQATLLLVRERGPATSSRPSTAILLAIAADITAISLLALTGTLMTALPASLLALVAVVVVGAAVAVDVVKVAWIRRTGAFGPASSLLTTSAPVPP
jgi:H+-transporting ATPase